jgi:hypothetical protein
VGVGSSLTPNYKFLNGGCKVKHRSFFVKVIFPILLLLLLCALVLEFIPTREEKFSYKSYSVQAGDTLWSISTNCNLKQDIRKTVYLIRRKNDITPVIQIGQEILVPVAGGNME